MSVSAIALATDIIAEFPGDWDWPSDAPNRVWLDKLCEGFVSMWQVGLTNPGTGPPPVGSYPHTHAVVGLTAATMSAPAKALGYTSDADAFVDVVSQQIATYLMANTVSDSQDGVGSHKHGYSSFGSASTLSNAIVAGAAVSGVGISSFTDGFAAGLIKHLENEADMTLAVGAGHVHTLQ